MNPQETRALLDFFKSGAVNDEVLKAYCERNKVQVINVERYDELMVQDRYDAKLEVFIPKFLALLAQFQFVRDYIDHNAQKAKTDTNEKLEIAACKLVEDCDFTTAELELLPRDLQNVMALFGSQSIARVNNMVKTMLHFTAAAKYGEPISVKALGDGYREVAVQLGKKE